MILVDPEDQWLLDTYKWSISSKGYVKTNIRVSPTKRVTTFLHHCIMGQPIWETDVIAHRDDNKLNNRRSNLAYWTDSQNKLSTTRPTGRSGMRNIYMQDGRYAVQVSRNSRRVYLGMYGTLEEAQAARDKYLS